MHVLQLGPYPPPEGGINRNMLAIRDELQENEHQCSIIATSKSTKILNEENAYHPPSPPELIKLLKRLDYDILHLHVGGEITKRVLGLIAACAFFGRGKSVLSIHSGGYPESKEGKAASKNSIRGGIFRQFEHIITVNPLIAEVFKKYNIADEKISVIYPFAHKIPDKSVKIPDKFQTFINKHEPFLLTVCLLEETYDLFMQIDALEKVLEKFPNAGLMIVGSGSLESDLKSAIAEKSYADKIFLAGDVENKVTLHLINKADIMFRTTKFDGDAISVREALFLDTKVIATDNGMRPEGVHLIPIHNKVALAEKIIALSGCKKTPKITKDEDNSNISKILDVYEQVTSQKKRQP